jgi:hypothetical protein
MRKTLPSRPNRASEAVTGSAGAKRRRRGPRPASEAILDAAIEYTFPASDPIAIQTAFERARRREAAD